MSCKDEGRDRCNTSIRQGRPKIASKPAEAKLWSMEYALLFLLNSLEWAPYPQQQQERYEQIFPTSPQKKPMLQTPISQASTLQNVRQYVHGV